MKVEFVAAMQGATCLKFDADRSGLLKLHFAASEAPAVVELMNHTERLLKVTVELSEE